MKALIKVQLKNGILDPQGKAVNSALNHLGFEEIQAVRIGKLIEMNLSVDDKQKALQIIEQACKKMLANPVIEDYTYEIVGV
jgi:phosphoribosylformylglycinamidine synthase PurS subunit